MDLTRASPEPTTTSLGALGEWVSVAGNPGNARDIAYVEVDVPAPLLGEQTDAILAEVGFTPEMIARLRKQGAVA